LAEPTSNVPVSLHDANPLKNGLSGKRISGLACFPHALRIVMIRRVIVHFVTNLIYMPAKVNKNRRFAKQIRDFLTLTVNL
jgi:hypothetical protein